MTITTYPDYTVFLRAQWNYDTTAASNETALTCDPAEDMTQQHFAEEVDINTIVRRFGLTGKMPETLEMPVSGDFTKVVDFQTAMQMITNAQQGFMTLPADIRKRFGHDPQNLMDFLEEPNNREEALKLGLLQKPPEVTRDVVKAVDDLAAKLTAPEKKT